jgi:hypothetical protein
MGLRMVVLLTAALGAASCGSSGATGGSSTHVATSSEVSSPAATTTTTQAPTIDPRVVQWKRRWTRKVKRPLLRAVKVLIANAPAAVNGDSAASYRLTGAFNTLSNCQNRLGLPRLSNTPGALARARALTLAACRSFYVGVDKVVNGLNAGDTGTALAGVAKVKQGLSKLGAAGREVAKAPTTTPS